MAYFDFLIDRGNKVPKLDTEYLYLHDLVWNTEKGMESFPIHPAAVVTNVQQKPNGSFTFDIPGREGRWCTNYGWALAENTEANLHLWEEVQYRRRLIHAEQRRVSEIYAAITLAPEEDKTTGDRDSES